MAIKFFLLGIVGVVICGNGLASAAVTPNPALLGISLIGPAPHYNCTANGEFPHETDCEYFYSCWNGEATLLVCTEMTLFDLRWKNCDNAENVNCGDRIRPTGYPGTVTPPMTEDPDPTGPTRSTTTTTTQPTSATDEPPVTPPPENYTCPSPGGAFPHERYCEYYWLCQENVPTLTKCQEDYLFDLVYMGCNFPEKTNCQDRERPEGYPTGPTDPPGTPGPTLPTPPPENYTCPEPGGAFPHEERCEYYWLCQEDVPTLTKCQLNFLFDLRYHGCNYPEDTDCQDRKRPPGYPEGPSTTTPRITTTTVPSNGTTTTTTRRPGPGFECPPGEDDFHPDPEDCGSYYFCFAGHPFCFNCPGDLHYNPETKECDYQENVDCTDRPSDQ